MPHRLTVSVWAACGGQGANPALTGPAAALLGLFSGWIVQLRCAEPRCDPHNRLKQKKKPIYCGENCGKRRKTNRKHSAGRIDRRKAIAACRWASRSVLQNRGIHGAEEEQRSSTGGKTKGVLKVTPVCLVKRLVAGVPVWWHDDLMLRNGRRCLK